MINNRVPTFTREGPTQTAPIRASRPSATAVATKPELARRSTQGHDADLYKKRNTVERLINKLKAWRGIATRYDRTPDSYLAGLHLRASMIWIKDLTRTTH